LTIADTTIRACSQCGTQLSPAMNACPRCGRLVHGDHLASLVKSAQAAADAGDITAALTQYRESLVLLPAGSKQHQIISARIGELGKNLPAHMPTIDPKTGKSAPSKALTGMGAIGLLVWKLKALLLGLSKGTTLWTMVLSLGVYWAAWGWKFALGLVLSIYVHEMGHVIALRRYGFKATAPMFIPGLGALIRLQQHVVNSREDAEIGLAGPIYGLGAALSCLAVWYATGNPFFAAIAGVGAWINLFNLLPIGSLDGGRGFHAMSRPQKLLAAAVVGAAWYFTGPDLDHRDGLLLLIGIVCAGRVVVGPSERDGNWKATLTYVFLVIALTTVAMVRHKAGVE
jgi:Zn-dependent protease